VNPQIALARTAACPVHSVFLRRKKAMANRTTPAMVPVI
jgi:hypothetical protein